MNINPTYFDAVFSLVGGIMSGPAEGPISDLNFDNNSQKGVKKDYILPTESEIQAEVIRLQAEFDAQAYARNRKSEYNALNQFELMTDDAANSTTTHADAIAAIKLKHPKS
jgi:hypothetical protein